MMSYPPRNVPVSHVPVSLGHYLDYNATAPLRDEAWQAMQQAASLTGNPSSTHRSGQAARRVVEEARQSLATALGAEPAEVIFTSGGTESNNLAMQGLVSSVRRIFVSAIEHDSVLQTVRHVRGVDATIIPVTDRGVVDLGALRHALLKCVQDEVPAPTLVSVMLVNNETGVIQPLDEIVTLAHAHGAHVHVDAVQAIGKIPVVFHDLSVDLMTISAHKCGGPQGVGALIVREGLPLQPQMHGGRQELGRRAGTESPLLVAGFAAAVARAVQELRQDSALSPEPLWQQHFEARLRSIAPDVVIFGEHAPRVPTTSCFAVPGFSSESQIMALNWDDVYISAGAACSSGKIRPSHVLRAMGVAEDLARCAVRVSWGYATTWSDIERCLDSWASAYQRRRSLTAQPVPAAHHPGFINGSPEGFKAVQGSVS